ncbi:MAG: electron transfer flavoprotein subunit alpha/FixB family protein [Firmicutes bacterium]|nr:electron transfer flavoprotein subunit alpha/FixB family protein [Bacillota bacterium]
MKALIFTELKDGAPFKGSLELYTLASSLEFEAYGLIIGKNASELSDACIPGAVKVFAVKGPEILTDDILTDIVHQTAQECGSDAVFFAATTTGKALTPRVAARLGAGSVNDCTKVVCEDDHLVVSRPLYGGTVFENIRIDSPKAVLSIRPGSYEAQEDGAASPIEDLDITVDSSMVKTAVKEVLHEASEDVNLEEAKIIVSGGRGMGSEENFDLIYQLAEVFDAGVGASRPVIESGWINRQHQVGQSGKIVSPDLYIACGISGAVQHLAGMSGSKYIIAINKDEDAPIFDIADLGIVGDVKKVLPILIESAKEFMAGR